MVCYNQQSRFLKKAVVTVQDFNNFFRSLNKEYKFSIHSRELFEQFAKLITIESGEIEIQGIQSYASFYELALRK